MERNKRMGPQFFTRGIPINVKVYSSQDYVTFCYAECKKCLEINQICIIHVKFVENGQYFKIYLQTFEQILIFII